jgi:hypothetical protein
MSWSAKRLSLSQSKKKQKAGNYNHDNGHDNDAAP